MDASKTNIVSYHYSNVSDLLKSLNTESMQTLLTSFGKAIGTATAIVDLEGNVIIGTTWQRSCTQFHRKNPETCSRCNKSDTTLAKRMMDNNDQSYYECENGLVDAAVPILIDGKHVANFFIGQFFLGEPDIQFFEKQCEAFGFDKEDYLKAIDETPRISEDNLKLIMSLLKQFAQTFVDATIKEGELNNAKKEFAYILDSIPAMIFYKDTENRFIRVNQKFADEMGMCKEELEGKSLFDLYPKEQAERYWADDKDVFASGQAKRNIVEPIETADKGTIWIKVDKIISRNSSGDTIGIIAFALDITEQKNTEDVLLEQHKKFLSIFDNIDEIIYVSDPQTYELLYCNESFKNSFGGEIGQKCHKVIQNFNEQCPFCTNQYIFNENLGKTYTWEFQNLVTKKWYHCIDKAIPWPDGRMVRYEMAFDITERKSMEVKMNERTAELQEKNEELIRLNRFMLGREKRMAELKENIALLKKKLNES